MSNEKNFKTRSRDSQFTKSNYKKKEVVDNSRTFALTKDLAPRKKLVGLRHTKNFYVSK